MIRKIEFYIRLKYISYIRYFLDTFMDYQDYIANIIEYENVIKALNMQLNESLKESRSILQLVNFNLTENVRLCKKNKIVNFEISRDRLRKEYMQLMQMSMQISDKIFKLMEELLKAEWELDKCRMVCE